MVLLFLLLFVAEGLADFCAIRLRGGSLWLRRRDVGAAEIAPSSSSSSSSSTRLICCCRSRPVELITRCSKYLLAGRFSYFVVPSFCGLGTETDQGRRPKAALLLLRLLLRLLRRRLAQPSSFFCIFSYSSLLRPCDEEEKKVKGVGGRHADAVAMRPERTVAKRFHSPPPPQPFRLLFRPPSRCRVSR